MQAPDRTPEWTLDPRLEADTHPLVSWPHCELRLMDDRRWTWLVLVPRAAGARELLDLEPADRTGVRSEIDRAALVLRALCRPDKLNIAALGNVVPQLHVHVIARFASDAAWPRPVWGVGERTPYPATELDARLQELRAAMQP